MAFQGLAREFRDCFVKKHKCCKGTFFQYATKLLAKIVKIPETAKHCDKVLPTSEDKPACQKTPILGKRKSFEDLSRVQKKRRLDNVKEAVLDLFGEGTFNAFVASLIAQNVSEVERYSYEQLLVFLAVMDMSVDKYKFRILVGTEKVAHYNSVYTNRKKCKLIHQS